MPTEPSVPVITWSPVKTGMPGAAGIFCPLRSILTEPREFLIIPASSDAKAGRAIISIITVSHSFFIPHLLSAIAIGCVCLIYFDKL
jgi:hypothetical protein